MVGEGERIHAKFFCARNKVVNFPESVKEGIVAMRMEMREFHVRVLTNNEYGTNERMMWSSANNKYRTNKRMIKNVFVNS